MKSIVLRLYQFTLVIMIFWGAHAWFTWWMDEGNINYIVYAVFFAMTWLYKIAFQIKIDKKSSTTLAFFILFLAGLMHLTSVLGIIEWLVMYIPLLVLLSDYENNEKHLKVLSITTGIVVIIGVVPFLLMNSGLVSLIGLPMQFGDDENYRFLNYGFFIENIYDYNHRFCSVFLEPGYLGTFAAFLLFINNFNLKKYYNIFLFIGLALSFSLAGYLIAFVGYMFRMVESGKKHAFAPLIVIALVSTAFFFYIPQINNGNNKLNELIVERLQPDEEKGIAGNDRFHGDTDAAFEQSFGSSVFWVGMSRDEFKKYDIEGAGFKIYILKYGLIHLLLVVFFYLILAANSYNKKHNILAFILLLLIFTQATTPSSGRWMLTFALMIPLRSSELKKRAVFH